MAETETFVGDKARKLLALLVKHEDCLHELSEENILWALGHPRGAIRILGMAIGELNLRFPIWRYVELGACTAADSYRDQLVQAGYRIGDWADELLGLTPCAQAHRKVGIVCSSLTDLGLHNGADYEHICASALDMGLELCPPEVGPALRLTYPDQSPGERLRVAMTPPLSSSSRLGIFALDCNYEGTWLQGVDGRPSFFRHNAQFLFVQPQPASEFN